LLFSICVENGCCSLNLPPVGPLQHLHVFPPIYYFLLNQPCCQSMRARALASRCRRGGRCKETARSLSVCCVCMHAYLSVCCFGGSYWCVVLRCVTRVTLWRLALVFVWSTYALGAVCCVLLHPWIPCGYGPWVRASCVYIM